MLDYNHSYYVTIDEGVLTLPDHSFHGISKEHNWNFKTKDSAPASTDTLIVDANGQGDFNTVQGALDFIPDFSQKQTVILIQNKCKD